MPFGLASGHDKNVFLLISLLILLILSKFFFWVAGEARLRQQFNQGFTMSEHQEFQPRITAFLCSWCSYGAADLAGVSRMQYPPHIRVIMIPCTGHMNPKFILQAFRQGVDGVWVSG